jgi:hypothetical protein
MLQLTNPPTNRPNQPTDQPTPNRSKVSLNEVAAQSTMRLIQGALDAGVRLTEVFIDTVGEWL